MNDISIVGIAGPSGSGKTTVARAIQKSLPLDDVRLLHHDNYYRDLSSLAPDARDAVNFDHPDALENELLAEHLDRLVNGEAVEVPQYDFSRHVRREERTRIEPGPVVIVEGILILAIPELRERFDIGIYVDTDADLCLIRRAMRDIAERGRDFESLAGQYLDSVRPMFHEFVLPSRRFADVVIAKDDREAAIGMIAAALSVRRKRGTGGKLR